MLERQAAMVKFWFKSEKKTIPRMGFLKLMHSKYGNISTVCSEMMWSNIYAATTFTTWS